MPLPPDVGLTFDGKLFRWVGAVLTALVLMQAVLAGQFLNTQAEARGVHRIIGEFLGLLAVVLMAQGYRLRGFSPSAWWLSVAVFLLVVAQTGLGFAGREVATAAALHVPVGVLTFGVALLTAMPLRTRGQASRQRT